jgi:hypothetical protein
VLKRAISIVFVLVAACGGKKDCPATKPCPESGAATTAKAGGATKDEQPIGAAAIADAKAKLIAKHGEAKRADIERGVDQVGKLWRVSDGDLTAFCMEQYLPEQKDRDVLFDRLQEVGEQMRGHFLELGRTTRWNTEVDTGPVAAVEPLLAAYDPGAHATGTCSRRRSRSRRCSTFR